MSENLAIEPFEIAVDDAILDEVGQSAEQMFPHGLPDELPEAVSYTHLTLPTILLV